MGKHTFDPWTYARSGYGSRNADFDIVSVSTGGRIASTPYEDKARLISAVPDLVFVLQQSIPSLERLALEETRANQAPTGLKKRSVANDLLKQARAAIARARGE